MSLKQKRNPNGIAQIHLGGVTKNRPSPLFMWQANINWAQGRQINVNWAQ